MDRLQAQDLAHILSLAPELIAHIFEGLDHRTLLSCIQVCSSFKTLIEGTPSLQYIIELAVRGQKDAPYSSAASPAQRLDQLRKHTSAWKNLAWSRVITIPSLNSQRWKLLGGVLVQLTNANELHFWQLPSDLRGVKERTWILGPELGITVAEFAIDPVQDLLVLIEEVNGVESCRVHLRALSTGKPHHLARTTVFQCETTPGNNGSFRIRIFARLIGIQHSDNNVLVWDWQTGELLVDLEHEGINSFALISDHHLLVAIDEGLEFSTLRIMDFEHKLPDIRDAHIFMYPDLADRCMVESLELCVNPGPLCGVNSTVPFYQDTQDLLVVATISVWVNFATDQKHLIHFFSAQHLLSLTKSGHKVHDEDWITQHTRMRLVRPKDPTEESSFYAYGTRFVEIGRVKNIPRLRLYDFNQSAIRKDAQRSAVSTLPGVIVSVASKIPAGEPFCEDIQGASLPFWSKAASLQGILGNDFDCDVMCSEDNIVIVDYASNEFKVLVF